MIEEVLRAQFGDLFKGFGALRRRRNEIEYPTRPGDDVEPEEAAKAIETACRLVETAQKLLPNLEIL